MTDARSARDTTYANPDGTFTLEHSDDPVRIPRGTDWVSVDTTLISQSAGLVPRATLGSTVIGKGGTARAVTASFPGASLGVEWPANLPVPAVAGDTATYADVRPGVDLVVTAQPNGFEYSVVLRTRSTAALAAIPLNLPRSGLSLQVDDDGSMQYVKSDGTVLAHALTPVMYGANRDSAGRPTRTAGLATSVQPAGAGRPAQLLLSPDAAFLADPTVSYPVTLDPVVVYGRSSDTYVQASTPTTNYNGAGYLIAGTSNGGADRSRSLITVNVGALAGKHILSATASLFLFAGPLCTNTNGNAVNAHAITGGWNPATVTWNTLPAYYATAAGSSAVSRTGASGCPGQYVDLTITSTVQSWANGSANYGLLVKTGTETDNNGLRKYYSADHTGSVAPTFTITYNSYPAVVAGRTTTPAEAVPSGGGYTLYTRSTTPTLRGASPDADGGTNRIDFQVYDNALTTLVASSPTTGAGTTPAGTVASWTVPGSVLSNGTRYQWRARAWDGTDYSPAWSSWVPIVIDTTAPAAPSVASTAYPAGQWNGTGGTGSFTLSDTATDVDHYLYAVDEATPTTATASPLSLDPGDGWHALAVQAVDTAGNLSPVATYSFGTKPGFTSPRDGAKTQGSVTLTARGAPGYSTITYNYRRASTDAWTEIPAADVTQDGVAISAWPVTFSNASGDSVPPALVWNVAQTLHDTDGPVQLQACFTSGYCSSGNVNVTLDENEFGDSYATEDVGPGKVSLLTGNYSISATDASVTSFGSDLTLSRTFNSRTPTSPATGIFGPGWTASLPVDEAGADWASFTDTGSAVALTDSEGAVTSFAKSASGYRPTGDDEGDGLKLTAGTAGTYGPTTFTVTDLDGNATTFSPAGTFSAAASLTTPHAYSVSSVAQPGNAQTTSYTYAAGKPTRVLAPVSSGATCTSSASVSTWTPGCRALQLAYDTGGHVTAVTFATTDGTNPLLVDVACYDYDANGRLAHAWDPRLGTAGSGSHPISCGTPVLATGYGYDAAGRISSVTAAGLAATALGYDANGRLSTVSRTHDSAHGGGTETSTVTYGVSIGPDGANSGYRPDLTGTAVATWAQTDAPVTATVVYGPSDTVSGSDLRDGEVHYLDVNGREANTASYSGTGAAGWHVETTEYDATGQVLRMLSAGNREDALTPTTGAGAALGLPADTAAAARMLSTHNLYRTAADGVSDLIDTFGPLHLVTLPDGSSAPARAHTHLDYDTGTEIGHPAGGSLHLETSRTVAASLSPDPVATTEQDVRTTTTDYALSSTDTTGWTFRAPMRVITDPGTGHLNLTRITRYDATTGLPIESRMPSNPAGGGAGTTLSTYYAVPGTGQSEDPANCLKRVWANLLCRTAPAAQPGVTGLPGLVSTSVTSYDYLNRPTVSTETVTPAGGGSATRTSTTTYGSAGYSPRVSSVATTGGLGAAVPARSTSYDPTTGLPVTVTAAATAENPATSATTGYDDFGRMTSYAEADEATGAAANPTTTSYDAAGRVAVVTDAHSTLTYSYDGGTEHRGLATALAVTVAAATPYTGSLAASYGADGELATQTYPNGVVSTRSRDQTGAEVGLVDAKGGTSWLADTLAPSIHGQARRHDGAAADASYGYDAAGRLTTVADAVVGGSCTTRSYALDADSNRTGLTSYPADATGGCQSATGGVTSAHGYDTADRLQPAGVDAGLAYDAFGRITTLPAADATGTDVTVGYYTSDLVRSQASAGRTLAWTLDAAGRLRARTDSASSTGTRTNHYDDPSSDAPDWIAESTDSSSWTANVTGLDANLALTVDATGTVTYQFTNIHGDIAATATATDSTGPSAYPDADEYGVVRDGVPRRYGWLGGKQRAADDLGGLVLMGVRLYDPTLGRFLQVDPVPGGSANVYDYCFAAPLSCIDLDGRAGLDQRGFNGYGAWGQPYTGREFRGWGAPRYLSNLRNSSEWAGSRREAVSRAKQYERRMNRNKGVRAKYRSRHGDETHVHVEVRRGNTKHVRHFRWHGRRMVDPS